MVVSFGRSTFKFTEDHVSICLEAVLGGLCGEFKVSLISERVFSFRVASKQVGFHIIKLRKFVCPQFTCYFHLWGHGGPNWQREYQLWSVENANEWTLVSSSRSARRRNTPTKPILKSGFPSMKNVGKKLAFAEHLSLLCM
jgi:hypothetical protein